MLDWYVLNKRHLPWRQTNDPYKIWLSEIILQQTRVDQGLEYYNRFVKTYPKVGDLSSEKLDKVLKMWQGLGYYSRARNLHLSAQMVVNQYDSKFPDSYAELLKLKGVGSYTAAAIASIAFNEPVAVLDGNVFRLLARYFGIFTPIDSPKAKAEFFELANSIIDKKRPGDFNQAMMDFGAMVCTPKQARCVDCPLSSSCYAFAHRKQDQLPVKSKQVKQRDRIFSYFLLTDGKKFLLQKREQKDIWKDLYELPLVEENDAKALAALAGTFGLKPKQLVKYPVMEQKHQLSHQTIWATFYIVQVPKLKAVKPYLSVTYSTYLKFAVARLTELFFQSEGFNSRI